MRFNPRRNGLLALISAAGLAACAESSADLASRPCPTPRDSILGRSVAEFIDAADPAAFRYLVAAGTDSMLPTHGHWALQGRTPLYLYPADPAVQQRFVTDLYRRGNYPTLLVSYFGQDTLADGRITTELSGTYIGGRNAGKIIPHTTVVFDCHATGDRFTIGTGAAASPDSTPAAAPDTTQSPT
jgi:hypothetical protein